MVCIISFIHEQTKAVKKRSQIHKNNEPTKAFGVMLRVTSNCLGKRRAAKSNSGLRFRSTHIDATSGLPSMVNVLQKRITPRTAVAESSVWCPPVIASDVVRRPSSSLANETRRSTTAPIRWVHSELVTEKKGSVFATAIIAGTMAAKGTSQLIPFCHPLPLEACNITCSVKRRRSSAPQIAEFLESSPEFRNRRKGDWLQVLCRCRVSTTHKTGVEMEAMVGASVAALTIYDMLKGVAPSAQIDGLHVGRTLLISKAGGKTDFSRRHKK